MEGDKEHRKILFLCTGNSARSIFAEYLMNKIGAGRFEAYSAGSEPTGKVNPLTLRVLKEFYNIEPYGARSKPWDEFKGRKFDFVITVCDRARQTCPVFPGQPTLAHWNIADPALAAGTEEQRIRVFKHAAQEIKRRIELFLLLSDRKGGPLIGPNHSRRNLG